MTDPIGLFVRRAGVVLGLLFTVTAPAMAQPPAASTEPRPGFLTRYDFSMSAAGLKDPDPRFTWDTHWAGDFDLVDYGYGRATFLGDYQALLGSEFRAFDPYQSNYLLEASGSVRAGRTEFAGVLNHVSRHLGDRFKRTAVAENSLGVRVMRSFAHDGVTVDLRVDIRKVIAQAYVDYTGLGDLDIAVRRRLNGTSSAYLHVIGEGATVDPLIAGRPNQYGGRAELGVRIKGVAGSMDLFLGSERVIDADPLDRIARRWAFFGFRLVRN